LETGEVSRIVDDFRKAARYAFEAGFRWRGVAWGLRVSGGRVSAGRSNRRGDQYGGTPFEPLPIRTRGNGSRGDVWGAEHVGMRIFTLTRVNDMLAAIRSPLSVTWSASSIACM